MEILTGMLDLVGCTIKFNTYEGDYQGFVKSVCPDTTRIGISKLTFLPTNTFLGMLIFRAREINSYSVVSWPSDTEIAPNDAVVLNSYSRPVNDDSFCFGDVYEAEENIEEESVCMEDAFEEDYVLSLPKKFCDVLPLDSVILQEVDEEFHLAIRHLMKQTVVGVCFEGPNISRDGILSWVCISSAACTFLFDIQSLKKAAFDCGLREVFENKNIEKVIHDCRQASDCLFHQFNTRLVNVFDTQVADYMISMQRSKEKGILKYVNPINTCLFQHLDIPQEFLYVPKKYYTYESKVLSFSLRPISNEFRDLLIKNSIYLRLLKDKLLDLLLNPFRRAVDVYLNVLQGASQQELLLEPSVPEMVPPSLLMDGLQTVCFKEFVDIPSTVSSGPPYRKLKDPLKKAVNLMDKCHQKPLEKINKSLMDKRKQTNKASSSEDFEKHSARSQIKNYNLGLNAAHPEKVSNEDFHKSKRSQMVNGHSNRDAGYSEKLSISNKGLTAKDVEKKVPGAESKTICINKLTANSFRMDTLEIICDKSNRFVVNDCSEDQLAKEILGTNSASGFKMKSVNSEDVWSSLRSAFQETGTFENVGQDKKKII
ncbi:Exonuclease 3'-5' domain-containing protein 1, partial [Stegodyphus mimosarum]